MPANKFALLRYRIIDRCIRANTYPSKDDLRQACEDALYGSTNESISASTIDKDIAAMKFDTTLGFEAPIKYSKSREGYYYENPNYSINSVPLNTEDIEAINFAALTLDQFKEISLFEQFGAAIQKILNRLHISSDLHDNAINQFVQFEHVAEQKGNEYLNKILSAIKLHFIVEINYLPYTDSHPKNHLIEPLLLKEYRHRWYVIANEIIGKKKKIKTFALERMLSVNTTTLKFTLDKNFNPDLYFKHSIGITSNNDKALDVHLSFSTTQGKYIKAQPIHHSQKILIDNESELRISIHVLVSFELMSLILGFGNQVKVLSPKSLQSNIKERLEANLNLYK
jgi:predicted DNA-binding transcriptional regulator YafY